MYNFNIDDHQYKHVHFIGIGGISMSGLAEILIEHEYTISGSDSKKSDITENLIKKGATIYYQHHRNNIEGADLIIYTDAISLENEELNEAIRTKVDIVDRATFLGAIMKNYEKSIAISGTHGKTTTTSMITAAIKDSMTEPTILLGGNFDLIKGNVQVGQRELILTEACEYKANILKYFPTTAVILNIDEDHLDFFDNIEHIVKTFQDYIYNLTEEDNLILNVDDEYVKRLINVNGCKIYTISLHDDADYRADNIEFSSAGYPEYDLYYRGKYVRRVHLNVMGLHNVYNSLAAIAACHINDMDLDSAIKGVEAYIGVHRRLEYKGMYRNAFIIDDYAHHPTEVRSSLNAVRKASKGDIFCIFQPHTFTRTKLLLNSFAVSFTDATQTIITDIYAAREKDYGDIHSKTLYESVAANGDTACYIATFDEIIEYLNNVIKPGDVIVTMGAGDVYKIGEMLLDLEGKNSLAESKAL